MRNIAPIGILVGALAAAVLPARADDQAIGFATGRLGGALRPAQTNNQHAARPPQVGSEAYTGFAQVGAAAQACSHSGGPKAGNWTCR